MLEGLGARLRVTAPCAHAVCLGCFQRLPPPPRCPLCRADLAPLVPAAPPPRHASATARALAASVALAERRNVTTLVLRRAPSLREAFFAEEAA